MPMYCFRFIMLAFAVVIVALTPCNDSLGSPSSLLSMIPPDVTVKTPEANLPPEIKSLSGKWAGTWLGTSIAFHTDMTRLDAVLIVMEIKDKENVTVVYAWGDCPAWNTRKGFRKFDTKITITSEGPVLEFGTSTGRNFKFRFDKATQTLSGITRGGVIDMEKMR